MRPFAIIGSLPQESLFPESAVEINGLRSRVIARRRDFDALFSGYTRLRAISYVVSLRSLLGLFEQGFDTVEVIVGDSVSDANLRLELAEGGTDTAERLARLMQEGRLRVLIPERTIHTKLYLLEREGGVRLIASSANLTETARRATRQINYAWYVDLAAEHPWRAQVEQDYQAHAGRCSLFMGDLLELLREQSDERRRELLEAWLKSSSAEEVRQEARKLLQEAADKALAIADTAQETALSIQLPEADADRRHLERLLSPLSPVLAAGELRVSAAAFRSYVNECHGVPLMRVDWPSRELRLALDGEVRVVSRRPGEPPEVNEALRHLEDYFETVELGQSPDRALAKTSLFEALLGLFASPFAHEFMRLKRSRYGAIDSRGPRVPYISGRAQNGKSTFLKFALRLICGRPVEPLSGGGFAKRKILGAASVGTAFPLVFDDLVIATHSGLFEEVLKSYWESWWRGDCVSPQLVISSNTQNLPAWAKSRLKRLDFDIHFTPSGPGKESLARLFRTPNPIFGYFAFLYLNRLALAEAPPEDELAWARDVFAQLYRSAGRSLPSYFPERPLEALFDPGLGAWRDLLHRMGKARVRWESDRAAVEFAEDLQHHEIREFEGHLPAALKHRRRGKTIIIESPREFRRWLEDGDRRSWWSRLGLWGP